MDIDMLVRGDPGQIQDCKHPDYWNINKVKWKIIKSCSFPTGAPDSVEIARQEIESHIIRRTGSCITPGGESTGPDDSADLLLASLCNSGLGSLGTILNYVNNGGDGCGYSGPTSADFGPFHSSSLHSIGLSSSQVRINEILGIL